MTIKIRHPRVPALPGFAKPPAAVPIPPIHLPDGVVLRSACAEDRDGFVALQAGAHASPDGEPHAAVGAWSAELFERGHPTVELADITVVEDPRTGAIVSGLTLVPQTWSYAGMPFGVGRLELVATHADYRRQGLIGRQFEALHERSVARGDLMQVVTDLMYFHQEFGYHSVLTQRAGRGGQTDDLPRTPADGEPARLRPAIVSDVPFLQEIDSRTENRSLIGCVRDRALWKFELTGRGPDNMMRDDIMVVQRGERPVGYVITGYAGIPSFPIPNWLPGLPVPEDVVSISRLELAPQASWRQLVPSVVRQLAGSAGYLLWLGNEHPAYRALGARLVRRPPEMGWFIRIPDPAAFLRRITSVLEVRLAQSDHRGFTGALRLHFYTRGLQIRFHDGRLSDVEPWPEHSRRSSDASMPVAMFLSLVLGHAGIADLAPAFPDHRLQTRLGAALLPVLFPKQPSWIWPVI